MTLYLCPLGVVFCTLLIVLLRIDEEMTRQRHVWYMILLVGLCINRVPCIAIEVGVCMFYQFMSSLFHSLTNASEN